VSAVVKIELLLYAKLVVFKKELSVEASGACESFSTSWFVL